MEILSELKKRAEVWRETLEAMEKAHAVIEQLARQVAHNEARARSGDEARVRNAELTERLKELEADKARLESEAVSLRGISERAIEQRDTASWADHGSTFASLATPNRPSGNALERYVQKRIASATEVLRRERADAISRYRDAKAGNTPDGWAAARDAERYAARIAKVQPLLGAVRIMLRGYRAGTDDLSDVMVNLERISRAFDVAVDVDDNRDSIDRLLDEARAINAKWRGALGSLFDAILGAARG